MEGSDRMEVGGMYGVHRRLEDTFSSETPTGRFVSMGWGVDKRQTIGPRAYECRRSRLGESLRVFLESIFHGNTSLPPVLFEQSW